MIYIQKSREPESLRKHRATPGADFDSLDKAELREFLLKEQGYLCAYCMRKIRLQKDVKIEHYEARNDDNQLIYSNLLAVCDGNQRLYEENGKVNKNRFTCDSMKGNTKLHINPQSKADMETIYYDNQGKLYSRDKTFQDDIDNVLNLNDQFGYLVGNRRSAVQAIINKLGQLKQTQDALPLLQKWSKKYADTDSNGEFEEYVGILRWYIDKQIRKHRM